MSGIKKTIYIATVLLIVSKLSLMSAIFFYPKVLGTQEQEINISSDKLIKMTNNYRVSQGLNPLSVNARLTQAAVNKATDMLQKQYFNHTSPDGKIFSEWIKEVGYKYFYVGENLAIDFQDEKNLFQAWLNSPTHLANIIKPQYQEIGLATIAGKYKNHSTVAVVQLFGASLNNNITTSAVDTPQSAITSSQKQITTLNNLEKLNKINNYLLIGFISMIVIIHKPQNKRKTKITSANNILYHANDLNE